MKTDKSDIVRRSDYQPPVFLIDTVDLDFELDPAATRVKTTLTGRLNPDATAADTSSNVAPQVGNQLLLNGEALQLVDLSLNGEQLTISQYRLDADCLIIDNVPAQFELKIEVLTEPQNNTSLSGLYLSNGNFFTQCEAEGFRRITFFPDRPDVMAKFTVNMRAERARYPVLLSNGNLIAEGECENAPGWHWANWQDPFPKPCYLFALVAGELVASEERVKTASGDDRLLQVWVEPGNEDRTEHAMQSLIRSMRWDETRYGLELDLDRFMIVAVADFNMGAMENKGLNIFNTKYVFANQKIATDTDFANVESVVGHEYFHNWTGNRITCRDWFQLTLKEGLTVFRDQEFSADMQAAQAGSAKSAQSARSVKRIEDVRVLRVAQFAEDAGPMAHAIRPDSYSEINNFYTITVYEKGAEVIRMLQTLVGKEGFERGVALYFERFDGQAVTCDDFLNAIADANDRDFSVFSNWYSQAGTPVVRASSRYDKDTQQYHLTLSQHCPPTPGQSSKKPFHIPFSIALLGQGGKAMKLSCGDASKASSTDKTSCVIELKTASLTLCFNHVEERPVPSLLRGFSAPVVLEYDYTPQELSFLARHDNDPFNRWEATQRVAVDAILKVLDGKDVVTQTAGLEQALRYTLADDNLDPAYKALVLALPLEGYVAEQITKVDPVAVRKARNAVRQQIAKTLESDFLSAYELYQPNGAYQADTASAGRRALKNLALGYLLHSPNRTHGQLAFEQFKSADNMTDQAGALNALVNSEAPQSEDALWSFSQQFADEPLVMDKWFTIQATMQRQPGEPPVLQRILDLLEHPAFEITNPNKIRSLVGAFCSGNFAEFHQADGSGYKFWLEQVRAIDKINPQVASRLARAMDRWRKFDQNRQTLMSDTLRKLAATPNLSRDVTEIVNKALAESPLLSNPES